MRQTTIVNKENANKKWYVVDAQGQVLGRLAAMVASVLRGKNKPTFTPNADMGDYVIVINAEKVVLTANKEEDKMYYHHSGYPGGLKSINAAKLRVKKPTALVQKAIAGMLPHTKLGNKQMKNLFVYAGPEHKHEAQKPESLEVK
ncbi:50S ribosomal protein L13 [Mycoplasmopsis californica HAZ160_1]|uniref:Large ribosomal subunit protein uL13 n=2 Tax=Mycoplasmopsis californica TaxID=2113 RepID=A0A059XWK7_9BACT|nr:50S ribosomal protein L13 [Mycoplasmopsis californica]AIA29696.1 50S ribosomal protein L13 [Mycoplasmopsis californica]BAP00874.1 50S ribosomal protein L13 [Mycoplasmopsis californica HAZ160_1]BBG40731.1 50S ribosomal protein L13 [Mycoplasmopsis californica]BBG41325.1 50S ribosomal protein L13 [Mycoplasmopsis californica]BBG41918.1 50S ribosomal protein L13 [Mycoplasmopsis californica]